MQSCYSFRRCLSCKGKHHTLLHSKPINSASETNSSFNINTSLNDFSIFVPQMAQLPLPATHLSRSVAFGRVLLATARIYVEAPNGIRVLARALIDQCSQVSIVSQSLCQRLRLRYKPIHASITGVGSNTVAVSNEIVQFTVRPRFHSAFSSEVQASEHIFVCPPPFFGRPYTTKAPRRIRVS